MRNPKLVARAPCEVEVTTRAHLQREGAERREEVGGLLGEREELEGG